MLFVCTLKLDPIYLDCGYNDRNAVLCNLFESFHMSALRLDSLLASIIFPKSKTAAKFSFLTKVVDECANKVVKRLRGRQLRLPLVDEAVLLYHKALLGVAAKRTAQYGPAFVKFLKRRVAHSKCDKCTRDELESIRKTVLKRCRGSSGGYCQLK